MRKNKVTGAICLEKTEKDSCGVSFLGKKFNFSQVMFNIAVKVQSVIFPKALELSKVLLTNKRGYLGTGTQRKNTEKLLVTRW